MPDLWLDGVDRIDTGRGLNMRGTDDLRLVTWHTMECGYDWSARRAAEYVAGQGSDPTFTFHPITGDITQLLPADRGCWTLRAKDPLTGISAATNTHGQIHMQVEVVGYAAKPWTADLTDEGRGGLIRLIEFFRSWGIPDQWADDIRPPVYPGPGVTRTQPTTSGHFHHAGWVVNDHGDPGAISDPWNPEEGTVTARSFNGWLVLDEYPTATFTAPGGKQVYCNSREVAVVLEY